MLLEISAATLATEAAKFVSKKGGELAVKKFWEEFTKKSWSDRYLDAFRTVVTDSGFRQWLIKQWAPNSPLGTDPMALDEQAWARCSPAGECTRCGTQASQQIARSPIRVQTRRDDG
jgi:hypothetical protein